MDGKNEEELPKNSKNQISQSFKNFAGNDNAYNPLIVIMFDMCNFFDKKMQNFFISPKSVSEVLAKACIFGA